MFRVVALIKKELQKAAKKKKERKNGLSNKKKHLKHWQKALNEEKREVFASSVQKKWQKLKKKKDFRTFLRKATTKQTFEELQCEI